LSFGLNQASEQEILDLFASDLESGHRQAIVVPRFAIDAAEGHLQHPNFAPSTQALTGVRASPPTSGAAGVASPSRASPAGDISKQNPFGAVKAPPSPGQFAVEVIELAAQRAPREVFATLLSLMPGYVLAGILHRLASSNIGNLQAYALEADSLVIIGIAYGFSGLAGVGVLRDLVECSRLIELAQPGDKETAAMLLARAIAVLDPKGLVAVLRRAEWDHPRRATWKSASSAGVQIERKNWDDQQARLQARREAAYGAPPPPQANAAVDLLQAKTLRKAADTGVPFCEICEALKAKRA